MNIRFVVDSACDVPDDSVARYGITVLPTYVNHNNESYADDGVTLDRVDYYTRLADMEPLPTTAAPSPGEASVMIHQAFEQADHLVLLSIAASVSGVNNTMRLGTADLPADRYTLLDSGQLSLAAGFQALIGAEVAAETGDLNAVLTAMRRARDNVALYAGLPNIDYVRRGGRVNWAVGTVGSLLRIRPVVSVMDGSVASVARVRKRTAWLETLAEQVRAHAPLDRAALLHTHNLDDLQALREQLGDVLPPDAITALATPTIGTHTGPHAVGVALLSKAWQQ